jgi:flagellar FliL protein
MKKLMPLLKLVARGLQVGLLISTVIITLAMAYIMFAPDSYPKPFYLSYYIPTPQPTPTPDPEGSSPLSPPAAHAAPAEGTPAVPLEIEPGQGLMIDTGTKIVNLSEPGGRKYIRVNIVLEFAPTDPAYFEMPAEEKQAYILAFEEEISARIPVINDSLITLLSGKKMEDVYTAEGKELLRQQVMDRLNSRLAEYPVIYVYFTEFVVQ